MLLPGPVSHSAFGRKEGERADTNPSQVEVCVGDRGCNRWHSGFSCAGGWVGAGEDRYADLGHVAHPDEAVVVEVPDARRAVGEGDVSPQRCGESVYDSALHLRLNRIRVDDAPAVDRAGDFEHSHRRSGGVGYLDHLRDHGSEGLRDGDAARVAGGQRARPSSEVHSGVQYVEGSVGC